MLRIIHIIPSLERESSGPTYSVVRLCESLKLLKNEIKIATLQWSDQGQEISLLQKKFPLGFGPRKLSRSPSMKRWLDKQVLSGSVDILHNHGMWQMNAIYPSWSVKKGDTMLVMSPRGSLSIWAMQHGSFIKQLFWPLFQRPAMGAVNCFHATSKEEYSDIRRLGFKQPVAIIPNGIDIPKLSKKIHVEKRRLLYLGRIHKVKGIDILLRAWRQVQDTHTGWELIIAGSDLCYHGKSGYLNNLQILGKRLGLKRVKYIGEQSRVEKFQQYDMADLFILPSHTENFAITVAESLASGTPVIASKGSPWSDLELHNAGWWVENDVKTISCCLDETLSLPKDTLDKMGQQGRRWMESEFSWGQIGCKMNDTYLWLSGQLDSKPEWIYED